MAPAKIMALTLLLGMLLCRPTASYGQHWSYSGAEGPAHWGDLDPENSACKLGHEQSPIDIESAAKGSSEPIDFKYGPSPLKIVNNGHSIQVNYAPGSTISVGGKDYQVIQFHFHHPSEEAIRGTHYDMVMHIVHKDRQGHAAVVAVLLKVGKENAALQNVWAHLPATPGNEQAVGGVTIDLAELLPATKSYYTFAGSLTTPPCSEGVRWFVLESPVEISPAQLEVFARLYPNNARPIQATNGRKIEEHPYH